MTDSEVNKVLRYLVAGAGIGTGLTTLFNAISDLGDTKRKKDLEAKIRQQALPHTIVELDPALIEQSISQTKPELQESAKEIAGLAKTASDEESPTMTHMLALLGGAAGLFGGTYLANKVYNKVKQRSLEADLEDAKNQYYTNLYMLKTLEEAKSKSAPEKGMYRFASQNKFAVTWSTVFGTLGAGAILAMIASGYLSRNILNKKYPKLNYDELYMSDLTPADKVSPRLKFVVKDKKSEKPDVDEAEDDAQAEPLSVEDIVLEEGAPKVAHALEPQVQEAILKLAAQLEAENGTNGGINHVVDAVALGKFAALKNTESMEKLFSLAETMVKSANVKPTPIRRKLAQTYIANDPILSEIVVPYAAAELLVEHPSVNKVAACITDKNATAALSIALTAVNVADNREAFAKHAAQLRLEKPSDIYDFYKSASAGDIKTKDGLQVLEDILGHAPQSKYLNL